MHIPPSHLAANDSLPPIEVRAEGFLPIKTSLELQELRQMVIHLTKLSGFGTNTVRLVHELVQPIAAASNT